MLQQRPCSGWRQISSAAPCECCFEQSNGRRLARPFGWRSGCSSAAIIEVAGMTSSSCLAALEEMQRYPEPLVVPELSGWLRRRLVG